MKYQFIKSIFGISLAICTAYGAVRGACITIATQNAAYPTPDTAYITESAAEHTHEKSASGENPETAVISRHKKKRGDGTIVARETQEEPAEILSEPEQEQEEAAITLADFLSGLHCGACGRNCSLLSPHCRNGMHKAQSAEQEYYEIYSVS